MACYSRLHMFLLHCRNYSSMIQISQIKRPPITIKNANISGRNSHDNR
jgi:hypothetical protein